MKISFKLKRDLQAFIDENFINDIKSDISDAFFAAFDSIFISDKSQKLQMENLNEILDTKKPTFSRTLMNFIDEHGLKDSDVYNKAGISRQLFSKIRIHENYKPTKSTIFLFALAMKLNLEETKELLASAGYSLSHSFRQDLILEFLISKGIHDISFINDVLYEFGEPTLGV